jgi:hypothetical protein
VYTQSCIYIFRNKVTLAWVSVKFLTYRTWISHQMIMKSLFNVLTSTEEQDNLDKNYAYFTLNETTV